MPQIRVVEFGPITQGFSQNNGFLDVHDVSVFIGPQGAGKSTVAKLISSFSWLEKSCMAQNMQDQLSAEYFISLLGYHQISSYLCKDSEIIYNGDCYQFAYTTRMLFCKKSK